MRAKPYIVAATSLLVLAACTSGPTSDRTPPSHDAAGSSPAADVLLLDTDAGPVAVSPPTGSILSGEAGAVAGPDGTRLYTTTVDGDHTVLVVRDAATDDQLSTTVGPRRPGRARGVRQRERRGADGAAARRCRPVDAGAARAHDDRRGRPLRRAPRSHVSPARQLRARGVLRGGLAAVPDPVPPRRGAGRLSRDRAGSGRRRRL